MALIINTIKNSSTTTMWHVNSGQWKTNHCPVLFSTINALFDTKGII